MYFGRLWRVVASKLYCEAFEIMLFPSACARCLHHLAESSWTDCFQQPDHVAANLMPARMFSKNYQFRGQPRQNVMSGCISMVHCCSRPIYCRCQWQVMCIKIVAIGIKCKDYFGIQLKGIFSLCIPYFPDSA